MAVKTYTKQEQAKIDARTREVADAKSSDKRNKMLMYIGGAVLVVGVAVYLLRKK